jgi:catechol 2,3-dioxygenase-like lactoylglutathione lyase family enzyme
MFNHVHLRVSDLAASAAFYATVLRPLGIDKTFDDRALIEFGDLALSSDGPPSANVHLAFDAGDAEAVDAFHRAAVEAGYRDNGAPGLRSYADDYYAAFVLDPDGNNVEAVHRAGLVSGDPGQAT